MKLICLNIEGGRRFAPLIEYIKKESATTDIFCFQEIFSSELKEIFMSGFKTDIYQELVKAIPEFKGYFSQMVTNKDLVCCVDFKDFDLRTDFLVENGLAIFVKKNISVADSGSEFVYSEKGKKSADIYNIPRAVQYLKTELSGKNLAIFNFHGLLDNGHKRDTKARTEQMSGILRLLNGFSGSKILCGDFNARPEAKCLGMLENNMENLIKTRGIATTRNHFYLDMEKYKDYISDYMFVSPEIKVSDFKVPNVEISDHLPLVLEFDV